MTVYLPCKGSTYAYNYLEFTDCIDQLNEIMVKYRSTHDILLGGDFNKIYSANITMSRRIKYLNEFIVEHDLVTRNTGKTFIHSNGVDSSTIDFIFYHKLLEGRVSALERLDELCENNSDHYPLKCQFQMNISKVQSKSQKFFTSQKVRWDKLDKDLGLVVQN